MIQFPIGFVFVARHRVNFQNTKMSTLNYLKIKFEKREA